MICRGSRPTVGSSKMITGGSWTIAWAIPTRCLKPLESLRIKTLRFSTKPQRSIAEVTLRARSPAGTCLILATKNKNPSTLISGYRGGFSGK